MHEPAIKWQRLERQVKALLLKAAPFRAVFALEQIQTVAMVFVFRHFLVFSVHNQITNPLNRRDQCGWQKPDSQSPPKRSNGRDSPEAGSLAWARAVLLLSVAFWFSHVSNPDARSQLAPGHLR